MQMRSAYAIRLYQFAKRWEFKRKYLVSVAELRGIMGALHPAGRGKTKAALGNYADFQASARCRRPWMRSTRKVTFS